MNNYETYTTEDFLLDSWFLAWVKHGQPEARQFWENWQQQYPAQRATLLLAKDMAEALKNRPISLTDEQVQLEVTQITRLTRRLPTLEVRRPFSFIRTRSFWPIAATVVILVAGSWVFWKFSGTTAPNKLFTARQSRPGPGADWVNQLNETSQPVAIQLPDGSRLTLAPHSQASYPRTFSQTQRQVQLRGEAVFAVVHDSSRPFLVVSGPLITRVLGTRFRVRAMPDDPQITVSVQSGKVSVYSQRDLANAHRRHVPDVPGVVLTANQQVVYRAEQGAYQKELVTKPSLINPSEPAEQFDFQDSPVADVFSRLEKSYGISITYDASVFRPCTVTASLAGVPLHDQLKLICASIGATYEVVDTHIVVSGKGCLS
ncbi:FecR family protein [Spirosoma fluviale]|uniref:FecR family protein n=1 Tax=Spirosoma fluviale TaxID=1597977 RepID=A0A286FZV2_9BACT|nr:FecR family protein [Spirosoma fluviale]SOD88738.1 FecR family protein [Spirosoma fluviale]